MAYNKFDEFVAYVAGDRKWNPATSNLYGIDLNIPNSTILDKVGTNAKDLNRSINLLAMEVTLPSRQLTTIESRSFGTMMRYASGTSFSEITISFLMTKDLWVRVFFERWMNYTTDDASSFVMIPSGYKGTIRVSKWENGSNVVLRKKDDQGKVIGSTRLKTNTGNWIIEGAFPFNISTMTLNNEETNLLKCDVSFYYDRYRMDNTGGGGVDGLSGGDKFLDDNNSLSTYLSSINSVLSNTAIGTGTVSYE